MNARTEQSVLDVVLPAIAAAFLSFVVGLPILLVFVEAFKGGIGVYFTSLRDESALAAIRLTVLVAAIAVPVNVLFGLAASWSIAKFQFPGRRLLRVLIELPLSVSPVVSGLVFVLLFGAHSALHPWLDAAGLQLIFAVPGLVIATIFVTLPFVAGELIPLMEAQGSDEEEAALLLGASGWKMFWSVTLPNIRWGLLYGTLLCVARSIGEFGAVSVVSGHIRGRTNTVPLHVELLYNEYNFPAAFAVASSLMVMAFLTLAGKSLVERRARGAVEPAQEGGR